MECGERPASRCATSATIHWWVGRSDIVESVLVETFKYYYCYYYTIVIIVMLGIAMATLGDALAGYFEPLQLSPLPLYYPGLHTQAAGTYEEDFQLVVKQMGAALPVRRIGVDLDTRFADPASGIYRGADFEEVRAGDIYTMRFGNGVVFIPRIMMWRPQPEKSLLRNVLHYADRIAKGGIVLTDIADCSGAEISEMMRVVPEALDQEPMAIDSRSMGRVIAMRKFY